MTAGREGTGQMREGQDSVEFAAVYLQALRLHNFRGLEECTVEFEPDLTVLVGRNNSGKSRILRAIAVALGARAAERDDLTMNGPKVATIDVILAPAMGNQGGEVFDVRAARRLDSVQTLSEDPVRERFAWRTTIGLSQEGLGVRSDRALLVFDQTSRSWQQPQNVTSLSVDQRSLIAADLVETGRDLVEELDRRGSPIRRILDDLDIASDRRTELEDGLRELGGEIITSSGSLAALQVAFESLSRSVDTMGSPSLQPLPIRLGELARSVSIDLDTGNGGLPVRVHGAGARSLTSMQVQGVLYDRRLGRDGPALRPHPISLIEEPEAHLHPQAQFELPMLLDHIQGQVIVSTHSTHFVSVVDPRSIRLLRRSGASTTVVDLRPAESDDGSAPRGRRPSMHVEEMEKLRRLVERPFGELLFASAVVIGDGATERALLPPLVRNALGNRAHGICIVDPGSMNSDHAVAVVKFANLIGIPWVVFCDSDASGVTAARRLVKDHGSGDDSRVIWVPSEPVDGGKSGSATERMFFDFDPELCAAACATIGFEPREFDLLAFMVANKGVIGRLLAVELLARFPWPSDPQKTEAQWPLPLCKLIAKLDEVLPDRSVHL